MQSLLLNYVSVFILSPIYALSMFSAFCTIVVDNLIVDERDHFFALSILIVCALCPPLSHNDGEARILSSPLHYCNQLSIISGQLYYNL